MSHSWTYNNGRSHCAKCGAWAADLRCCPDLRQRDGRYPTATDLQRDYACGLCYENIRARWLDGQLRVLCEGGHDVLETGRIVHQRQRDWIVAHQEIDAMDVLDGLPAELRAVLG